MGSLTVKHDTTLSPPWTTMPPLRLGQVRAGSPDLYLTITDDQRPVLRVDLYAGQETFCFTEAIAWGEHVFAGYGDTVYFIDSERRSGSSIALGSYFGNFFATSDAFSLPPASDCSAYPQTAWCCGRATAWELMALSWKELRTD